MSLLFSRDELIDIIKKFGNCEKFGNIETYTYSKNYKSKKGIITVSAEGRLTTRDVEFEIKINDDKNDTNASYRCNYLRTDFISDDELFTYKFKNKYYSHENVDRSEDGDWDEKIFELTINEKESIKKINLDGSTLLKLTVNVTPDIKIMYFNKGRIVVINKKFGELHNIAADPYDVEKYGTIDDYLELRNVARLEVINTLFNSNITEISDNEFKRMIMENYIMPRFKEIEEKYSQWLKRDCYDELSKISLNKEQILQLLGQDKNKEHNITK